MAKRSRPNKKSSGAVPTKSAKTQEVFPRGFWMTCGLQLLQGLLIAGAVAWIYQPALHGSWLMDDEIYFTANPLLQEPDRLWKAWFEPGSFIEYYPIEQTVQWMQWQLWNNDTFWYHITNIVLHICNALLVWKLLSKFHLKLAWLGGLIFAIHPIQVESVAWIMELKNTLSLGPFLLAMCAWIDYEEHRRMRDYWLAVGLFLVAMLCKISMAPFPVILLLYAWWKRGRIGWGDVTASLPFFAISLILGATTVLSGIWYRQVYPQPGEIIPMGGLFSRMACAGLSLSFYFSKCFLPVGLSLMYPKWPVNPPSLFQFLPWLALVGVIYICWKNRQAWGRHVLLGVGYFGLNLSPFLGLTAVSYMTFTWVMDHFLYLPIIGLIGLVIAGLEQLKILLSQSLRVIGIGAMALLMAVFAFESRVYAGTFFNMETIWTNAVQCNPGSGLAHNNLGFALAAAGKTPEAIEQLEIAASMIPSDPKIRNNLAHCLAVVGRTSEAIDQYHEALRLNPDYATARENLAELLAAPKTPPVTK